jgi:hypothetical protein
VWYELPGTDSATRIKFVAQPGIEEVTNGEWRTAIALPTIIRSVLLLPEAASRGLRAASLYDIAGHRVLDLRPGANDVSRLAVGVYVAGFGGRTARFVKVAAD